MTQLTTPESPHRMTRKRRSKAKKDRHSAADLWERSWQQNWSKVGLPGYELPVGGPGGQEREFLSQARTPVKEAARLKRINNEFARAFRALYSLGPAVTVFGSARFKENHPYYRLARSVGGELARAGFATLTGGGPGIMEAANRGAHEAGGASVGLNIILPHERIPSQNFVPIRIKGKGPIFLHWINVAASNSSSRVPSPPGITTNAHEYFTRQTLRVKK